MTKKKICKLVRAKKSTSSNPVKTKKLVLQKYNKVFLFVVKAIKL